jgi:hypothetical protein
VSEELKSLLRQIFSYYKLENNQDLKKVWVEDLRNFTYEQVKDAWDIYRKNDSNEWRPIKSWDLVKIINQTKRINQIDKIEDYKRDELKRDISVSQNSLIDNLVIMNKANPDLMKQIRGTNSPYEKLLICAVSLGNERLIKSPLMQAIIKKLNNPEEGDGRQ